MLKNVKIIGEGVTKDGKPVEIDEVIQLTEKSAASLVRDGLGEDLGPVEEKLEADPGAGEPGTDVQEKGDAFKAPITGAEGSDDKQDGKSAADVLPGAADVLAKALDTMYTKEPLAEAAKAAGVEFPYDAKKAEIIAAVIAAGKAQALIDAKA